MTNKVSVFAVALAVCFLCLTAWGQPFYVSPKGDDANPGTADKPFKTIGRAQLAVNDVRVSAKGKIEVLLGGGTYVLSDSQWFMSDGGSDKDHAVIYKAVPGEIPVISGGRTIEGWALDESGRWKVATDIKDMRQLYVNGVRAIRARGPFPEGGGRYGDLQFIDGDAGHTLPAEAMADWRNPSEIEFGYYNSWSHMICKVKSITRDGSGGVKIAMQQPCFFMISRKEGVQAQMPAYIENAFELLDEPGEWYFDKLAKTIYYIPRPGEDLKTATVVVPVQEELVAVFGTPGVPIRNIYFEGITFADATCLDPNWSGHADVQANFTMIPHNIAERDGNLYNVHNEQKKSDANVRVCWGQDIRFERCTFTRLGGAGLNLDYVQDCAVVGCRFYDISGSAIQVGDVTEEDHHPSEEYWRVKNNVISNNYIHDVGVEYQDSVGIFAGYVNGLVIAHNEICDLPYSGVSVGWGWGEEDAGGGNYPAIPYRYSTPTPAGNNRIEFNHIHDVMLKRNDGGGVYMLSNQPGTVIRGNHIHDNNKGGGPGGIYLDEGSGFIEITGNSVYAVPTPMNYNNRAQDRIATCNEHDNFFGIAPDAVDFPKAVVENAGLEPAYRDLLK